MSPFNGTMHVVKHGFYIHVGLSGDSRIQDQSVADLELSEGGIHVEKCVQSAQ